MITLYGKNYAKTDREFTESLFTAGGTCNGYYKATSRGIYLYDHQRKPLAFIRRDGLGPVSFTKLGNGKYRYSFDLCSVDAEHIGCPDSYVARCDGATALARSIYTN